MRAMIGGSIVGLMIAIAPCATAQAPRPEAIYTPPRSVTDIVGSVGARQADRDAMQQRQRLIAAEPPAGASNKDLVLFHLQRARAAQEFGDTARSIQDYRKAYELSRPGENYAPMLPNREWLLAMLADAEQYRGNAAEGLRLRKQLLEQLEDVSWRGYALEALASLQGQRGDLADLEASMRQADAIYGRLSGSSADTLSRWGPVYTRNHELTRAWYHHFNGRHQEAELAALRALRAGEDFIRTAQAARARGYPMGPQRAQIELQESTLQAVAAIQVSLNKLDAAEFHARKALDSMLSGAPHANSRMSRPLSRLGEIMLNRGRFKDAEAILRESLRVLEVSNVSRSAIASLSDRRRLAQALAAQERWPEALGDFREVQAQANDDATGHFGNVDATLAYAQLRAGEAPQAAAAVRERLDWYDRNGLAELPLTLLLRGIYAVALSVSARAAEADREFAAVLPKLIGSGAPSILAADATAFTELQKRWIVDGYLERLRGNAQAAADPAARARLVEEALLVTDAVRGRSVQLAIQQASARAAASTPALAALARREQDLRNEIGTLYAVLNTRAAAQQADPGGIAKQMHARIAQAGTELAQVAERMRKEFGSYSNLVAPKVPEMAQLRAAIRPGEALLVLHLAGDRAYVWLTKGESPVAFHSSEGRAAIEADIMLLRRALDPESAGIHDRIPEFDVTAAYRLYERLLKPLESGLADVRNLVVVAGGALQQLPLALLATAPHEATPDAEVHFRQYRATPWLAKRLATSQAPSLSAFLSLRARTAPREGRLAFAGFGDPIFSKEQAAAAPAAARSVTVRGARVSLRNPIRTASLDSAELARLARLPDTAEEIAQIARTLGAVPERDAYLGQRANEIEVKRADLANRRVIAFATHGLVPGDLDGLSQPALALTAPDVAGTDGDGLLTLEEVLGLKLDADWVVLSACNTASGDNAGAEAISGLGRAFFYAGARALLVSSWPVESVSAKLLTTRMFEIQAQEPKLGRAEALQRSMLELAAKGEALGADGKPAFSYAHPLFWAPFSVVGDGG